MQTHGGALRSCVAEEQRLAATMSAMREAPPPRRLRPGDYLFHEGTPIDTVSVMLSGLVALQRSIRGRRTTLTLMRRGGILEGGALTDVTRAPFDAVALAASEILSVPVPTFWQLLQSSPQLARLWVVVEACELAAYERRLLDLLAGDIRAQVASLLLHETDKDGSTAFTHQMMAELLGVQRSSVSRALSHLERLGIVELGYAHLRVRDARALELVADGYSTRAANRLRSVS